MTRTLPTAALALLLTACLPSSCTRPVINTQSVPQKALADTQVPKLQGKSNREVGVLAKKLKTGLESCNADKATIREAVAP